MRYSWRYLRSNETLGRYPGEMNRYLGSNLLRRLGWRVLLVTGDTSVLDRWLWVKRHLRPGARTFDAGAGNGAFALGVQAMGSPVVAASFSESEMLEARERSQAVGLPVEFQVIDLRQLAAHVDGLGVFEQIICLEVIEHLLDDAGVVAGLAKTLAPGGQLLVTAPYAGHHPMYGEDRNPDPTEDGSHVRFGYTPEQLAGLLSDAGLVVAEEAFVTGVVSQTLTNIMRRLGAVLPSRLAWILTLPLRPLALLDPLVSRRCPYLSVAARAVRPVN